MVSNACHGSYAGTGWVGKSQSLSLSYPSRVADTGERRANSKSDVSFQRDDDQGYAQPNYPEGDCLPRPWSSPFHKFAWAGSYGPVFQCAWCNNNINPHHRHHHLLSPLRTLTDPFSPSDGRAVWSTLTPVSSTKSRTWMVSTARPGQVRPNSSAEIKRASLLPPSPRKVNSHAGISTQHFPTIRSGPPSQWFGYVHCVPTQPNPTARSPRVAGPPHPPNPSFPSFPGC